MCDISNLRVNHSKHRAKHTTPALTSKLSTLCSHSVCVCVCAFCMPNTTNSYYFPNINRRVFVVMTS